MFVIVTVEPLPYAVSFFIWLNILMSMLPSMPEDSDARSTAIFPLALIVSIIEGFNSPNESVSTKMDIVKPIPPRQATAKSIVQFEFAGFSPILHLMAM